MHRGAHASAFVTVSSIPGCGIFATPRHRWRPAHGAMCSLLPSLGDAHRPACITHVGQHGAHDSTLWSAWHGLRSAFRRPWAGKRSLRGPATAPLSGALILQSALPLICFSMTTAVLGLTTGHHWRYTSGNCQRATPRLTCPIIISSSTADVLWPPTCVAKRF